MTYEQITAIVKKITSDLGIAEYELYCSRDGSMSCETFQHEIDSFSASNATSIQMRVVRDGRIGSATTELASPEEIEALVKRAYENAGLIESEDKAIFYRGGGEYRQVAPCPENDISSAELKALALKGAEILYAGDPRSTDGTAGEMTSWESEEHILNSYGLDLSKKGSGCVSALVSTLEEGEEKQLAYRVYRMSLGDIDMDEEARIVLDDASSKLGAGLVKSGNYDVVFDRDQVAQIIGTFIDSFFADNVQKGLSALKQDALGTELAAPCVTLTDDPFYPGNTLQSAFDGEGVPTYTKNIIEGGRLNTFLHNLTTAEKDGVESTGNGKRSGSKIGTGYFNVCLQPGTATFEQLLAKAEGGILITEMKGFHAGADENTGDFSIESAGYMIENGKRGRAVKSFTVAGNFFDLLKRIEEIDDRIDDRGSASTRIITPDILVRNMPIAGE